MQNDDRADIEKIKINIAMIEKNIAKLIYELEKFDVSINDIESVISEIKLKKEKFVKKRNAKIAKAHEIDREINVRF